MKYAIIEVSNGSYFVKEEGITNLANAKVSFHDRCKILWNAPDVNTACVMIADENLNAVEDSREFISHVQTEPSEL